MLTMHANKYENKASYVNYNKLLKETKKQADMFPGTLRNSSHVPQTHWGTGTVPHVPQNYLGNGNSSSSSSKKIGEQEQFPKFLKSILGKILVDFGE